MQKIKGGKESMPEAAIAAPHLDYVIHRGG
jgi:hypothetical protein